MENFTCTKAEPTRDDDEWKANLLGQYTQMSIDSLPKHLLISDTVIIVKAKKECANEVLSDQLKYY